MASNREQQLLEEIKVLKKMINHQKRVIDSQQSSIDNKQNELNHQNKLLKNKEVTIAHQDELIHYLKKKLYGRSKENLVDNNQLSLFEVDASDLISEKEDETFETISYRRKKRPKGRKQVILDNFPDYDLHYTLEGEDRNCSGCQQEMAEIGQKKIRQQLRYVPAEIRCENVIQHSYKCTNCSEKAGKEMVISADVPKPVFNGSYATAGLVSHSLQQKYELKIPAYRQEGEWEKMGLPLSRQTLINWHEKAAEYYFEPLYRLLSGKLIKQPVIHMDETSYKVIEHEKEKTYYWLTCSSRETQQQIYLYHHSPGRGFNDLPKGMAEYEGVIHCDMWHVYPKINRVTIAGCWAHLRRKFYDALPPKKYQGQFLSSWAVKQCDQFFTLEKKWQDLSITERLDKRQKILKVKIDHFFERLREESSTAGGKLVTAIAYALKYEAYFKAFLENGAVEMSNNRAERGIKALVIGRKNWLFSTSFKGAQYSGIILSIIETAKANGLDPEKYLTFLLSAMPNEKHLSEKVLEDYLPWHPAIQAICRKKLKRELLK
ncbi:MULTISPECIES: IS66 family transposase [Lactobacillales]|nr:MULTISPECIES: IS66 family transposase [Lactobacillales]MDK6689735.1 IS66 family transposase [Aerococcus urinae]MDK8133810.1 IS66 family transposase [Aerococcus urinae]MDK8607560.1 IS66 family transposase [Lactobacillus paragasseri]MDL5177758.1 IS66 family transposase [Aerococcus tenax]MDL5178330.1 IS66 family transposase [Aerococcus tenax]